MKLCGFEVGLMSDGPNSWPLARMKELLTLLKTLDQAAKSRPFIEQSLNKS